jgi:hypothetical protein
MHQGNLPGITLISCCMKLAQFLTNWLRWKQLRQNGQTEQDCSVKHFIFNNTLKINGLILIEINTFYFNCSDSVYNLTLHLCQLHTNELCGTRTWRFITAFTRAHQRSLSWARWIHSTTPQPITLRSILIPSSHLCLGLTSGLYLPAFPP